MSYSSVDTLWILMAAVLVFFMQPGFAMLEAGLTRGKNAGNIVMKNFMNFSSGPWPSGSSASACSLAAT